jgi:hypothetical protein
MAYFYGVYISDATVASLFTLLRFLAEPDFLRLAHITLRGPYKTPIDMETKRKIDGLLCTISIEAPGRFWEDGQNTVFIKCAIGKKHEVWYKPDYPNGFPHLTIYDGKNRSFAEEVYARIVNFQWHFCVKVGNLERIQKKQSLDGNFFYMFDNTYSLFQELFGPSTFAEVGKMNEASRLVAIEKVCRYMHSYVSEKSRNPVFPGIGFY